jgi:hypothetical protein
MPDEHHAVDARVLQQIAAEHAVRPRTLEHWRKKELLPSPKRQPQGRAVWHYPAGTEMQLRRLLHWRERTRSLGLIAISLWVEGFPISTRRVRCALQEVVRSIAGELAPHGNMHAYIERTSRKLASARGEHALPRVARMRSEERVRACAYLLAVALDATDEIRAREGDAVLVERMLGLRSGNGRVLAEQEPFIDSIRGLRPTIAPARLQGALDFATDEHLELARAGAALISVWMPVLAPELIAEQGRQARPFKQVLAMLPEPAPELHAHVVFHSLLAMQEKQLSDAEIAGTTQALASSDTSIRLLTLLAPEQRQSGYAALPTHAKASVSEGMARLRGQPGHSRGD